jgi:hypothetical protein
VAKPAIFTTIALDPAPWHGSTVAVRGSTAMLTAAARAGCWSAVVGMPNLGLVCHGIESGRGRLRCRSLTVTVSGRGAAGWASQARMWLPALTGPLPMIAGQAAVESGTTDPAVVAVGA